MLITAIDSDSEPGPVLCYISEVSGNYNTDRESQASSPSMAVGERSSSGARDCVSEADPVRQRWR